MAETCKWHHVGCGRRAPSSTEEFDDWQAPDQDLRETCWTGWGSIDPRCAGLAIERLHTQLASAQAELAESKEQIRLWELLSRQGPRPFRVLFGAGLVLNVPDSGSLQRELRDLAAYIGQLFEEPKAGIT
jgi:hypothetical protein